MFGRVLNKPLNDTLRHDLDRVQLEEHIYYCNFVSYLLVIRNVLEQKVILCFQKVSCYINFLHYLFNIRELHMPKRLTCFKFNYCIML